MSGNIITFVPQEPIVGGYDLPYNNMKAINDQIFLNTILFVYFLSSAIIVGVYLYKMGIFDRITYIPMMSEKIEENICKKLEKADNDEMITKKITVALPSVEPPKQIEEKKKEQEAPKNDLMSVD